MASFEIGKGRTRLRFTWDRCGCDLRLHISGGTDHIGAAAVAFCEADGKVRVRTTRVPGHLEQGLVQRAARRLSEELHVTTSVSAGIHLDRITREEIDNALNLVEHGVDRLIAGLNSRRRGGGPTSRRRV